MKTYKQFLKEVKISSDILTAISTGEFKMDIVTLIKKDIENILKKYTKGIEFTLSNESRSDLGVIWRGDDEKEAEHVLSNIIGDIYDYFNKAAQKKKPRIKKTTDHGYTYYNVMGWNDKDKKYNKSQISFFRPNKIENGKSIAGVLMTPSI